MLFIFIERDKGQKCPLLTPKPNGLSAEPQRAAESRRAATHTDTRARKEALQADALEKKNFTDQDWEEIERLQDEETGIILDQYQRVGEAIDAFFQVLTPRTRTQSWREDGVGSCGASPYTFDDLLVGGPVRERLLKIWRAATQKAIEDGRTLGVHACLHHEKDAGCILGSSKCPRCFSYFDQDAEELEDIDVDPDELGYKIRDILKRIQLGRPGMIDMFVWGGIFTFPEDNEPLVGKAVAYFQDLKTRVERSPVLFPEKKLTAR